MRSLRWSARLLGASSPKTMWSAVMIMKAIVMAMACAPIVANDPKRPYR